MPAIERLFELTTLGKTQTSEYDQLDHLVHQRLVDAYPDSVPMQPVAA